MTDLRKWSENAFVMLAGLKESVQWELAPEIMKEIKELVDAYPVGAAPSEGMKPEEPKFATNAVEQRQIDIINLRLYARLAEENEWHDETLHWSVFQQTLDAIATRLERLPLPALSPARSGEPSAPQTSAEPPVCCNQPMFDVLSDENVHQYWQCSDCEKTSDFAAPQPVSGDAPDCKKLPVGHWFFLDSPVCTNRYSVQERTDSGCTLVCSTPWHHDGAKANMQRIADLHNSSKAGDAPKVEEIAKQIAMECYEHMHITPTQEIGIMKHAETALRPYFPPASQNDMLFQKLITISGILPR